MKKSITLAGIAAAAAGAGVFAAADRLYDMALNPSSDKSKVLGTPAEDGEPGRFIDNVAAEEVWTESFDGLKLHGLLIDRPWEKTEHRWVICVHGYVECGKDLEYQAEKFYEKGFRVLLPDNRGHGKSQGSYVGMGWHDRLDILKWIRFLIERDPECRILLYGVSMGGAAVMMTAGEKLPANVELIIEDCGYTSAADEFAYEARYLFHLPYFPVVSAASLLCRKRAGYSFREASAVSQLKKADRPMLFIHGTRDRFVPFSMLEKVYQAAACPKEKLAVDGAAHAESCRVNPQLYWNTVFDFIGRWMS